MYLINCENPNLWCISLAKNIFTKTNKIYVNLLEEFQLIRPHSVIFVLNFTIIIIDILFLYGRRLHLFPYSSYCTNHDDTHTFHTAILTNARQLRIIILAANLVFFIALAIITLAVILCNICCLHSRCHYLDQCHYPLYHTRCHWNELYNTHCIHSHCR